MGATSCRVSLALKMDEVRSDLVRGLVWFVNYAAIDPTAVRAEQLDLHGAAMLPEDVEKFAHRWLSYSRSVDIEHDGRGRPVRVVESFFNGPDVASPAWPINSHAVRLDVSECSEAMDGLRSGRLNCVSLDAFTFDVVRRLPVATGRRAPPAELTLEALAAELAGVGFPGVASARWLEPGLALATRSDGSTLAVAVDDDEIEATPAGGAWGRVAGVIMKTATLTRLSAGAPPPDGHVPDHGGVVFPIDHRPWPEDEVRRLLASVAPSLGGGDAQSPWLFVRADGTGELPHHVIEGGRAVTSASLVMRALSRLDELPESSRAAARLHLERHLAEARP